MSQWKCIRSSNKIPVIFVLLFILIKFISSCASFQMTILRKKKQFIFHLNNFDFWIKITVNSIHQIPHFQYVALSFFLVLLSIFCLPVSSHLTVFSIHSSYFVCSFSSSFRIRLKQHPNARYKKSEEIMISVEMCG